MDALRFVVVAGPLLLWFGILTVVILRKDGRLSQSVRNSDILIPTGFALFAWAWIFSVMIFTG
ncbi:MAG: hypothetical protein AAF125_10790 [Chloroflexota bacterium]